MTTHTIHLEGYEVETVEASPRVFLVHGPRVTYTLVQSLANPSLYAVLRLGRASEARIRGWHWFRLEKDGALAPHA